MTDPTDSASVPGVEIERVLRQAIKIDASGLAPAVAAHYIDGFSEAARRILDLFAPILAEKEREIDEKHAAFNIAADQAMANGNAAQLAEARALAAEAALAGEREPHVEIRRNDDGSIDEVVAKGASVHLEQMDAGAWFLGLNAGDQTWQFWLRAKNPKTHVDIYHEHSVAAAIRAQGECA